MRHIIKLKTKIQEELKEINRNLSTKNHQDTPIILNNIKEALDKLGIKNKDITKFYKEYTTKKQSNQFIDIEEENNLLENFITDILISLKG